MEGNKKEKSDSLQTGKVFVPAFIVEILGTQQIP